MEETLITKNEIRVNKRGSEPIEKNISVIDETGKEYEATYPKRAKGLVKKGRARFVDENTVCLACPPNILEDTKMSDNNIKTNVNETAEPIEAVEKIEGIEKIEEMSGKMSGSEPELSVGYILSQIEKIQQDNEHIFKAISVLDSLVLDDGVGDIANQARCEAIGDVVKCRETTNQKLIAFYEKLYDDIKPPKLKSTKEAALEIISQAVNRDYSNPEPEQIANLAEAISSMLDGIRHIDH